MVVTHRAESQGNPSRPPHAAIEARQSEHAHRTGLTYPDQDLGCNTLHNTQCHEAESQILCMNEFMVSFFIILSFYAGVQLPCARASMAKK